MRRVATLSGSALLVAGPAALAFFAGGYFDGPRAAATAVAWAVVLMLAVAGPLPLPRSGPGWAAVAGLAGLAAWSAISIAWAPVIGAAVDNAQRNLLYLGALLAATALLRDRGVLRALEPLLAGTSVLVIAYGLSERLVPGLIDLNGSFLAGGRLEQPITYWNAEGLLAAVGLILAVRVAGDSSRPSILRGGAAVACVPLAVGIYLSYSRGAIAATVIGLLVLLAAAPNWPQLAAIVNALVTGTVASACAAALPGVAGLHGTHSHRVRDGLLMIAVLAVTMGLAALAARQALLAERRGRLPRGALRYARRLPALAGLAGALCVVGLIVGGLQERSTSSERADPSPARLASVSSRRYEYWRVAIDAFADHPLRGVGSGGFRVVWRQQRRVLDPANQVHSLELETATELGIPGLLLLGLFLGGIAVAARRALLAARPLAAGACAACTVFILHASIDWDWQLPAVTLPVLALAGGLIALAEGGGGEPAEGTGVPAEDPNGRQLAAVR